MTDADDEGADGAPAGRAEAFRWAREAMRRNAEAQKREAARENQAELAGGAPTQPLRPESSPAAPPQQPDPAVEAALQPTFEVQWHQLDEARRDLLAEWRRLGKARERIEALYEHLDEMRMQLEVERRQLVAQSEQVWIDRFQPVPLSDRPWRDAAAHVLEASVIVRAAVAQRAPELMARLRGGAVRRSPSIARRKELPPGGSS